MPLCVAAQSTRGAEWNRRRFLKASGWAAAGVGVASLIAACGGEASVGADGTLTLKMPFLQDMQVPDPDIMYEVEGLQVMKSCYEGLVGYRPGTAEIIPGLAESWTVSEDQLTYTFTLRPDVRFHDGTIADAAAWVSSFDRRAKVGGGPSYMVADVAGAEAPDPTTLVVRLAAPNNAWLHYAACPWQMNAVSPTAVETNAIGDDLAQEWFKTHDAGTGPYMIREFVPGSHYTLAAFPDYWGQKPAFDTIRIVITPSVATQKLQLDQGALDLVTKGLPIPDVLGYQANSDFEVAIGFGSMMALFMNFGSGIFADKAMRDALMLALDRSRLVEIAYQGLTEVNLEFWPESLFPTGLAPLSTDVDPGPLTDLVASLPSKRVDLAWGSGYGTPAGQLAELIQTQLAPTGLEITVRPMPTAESFDLVNQPPDRRPDLFVSGVGGDALHLDTLLRILLRTGAEPLNYFQYSNPEVDALMDEAITKPTTDEANQTYLRLTRILQEDAIWVPICRRPESVVLHRYLTGLELNSHQPVVVAANKLRRA